jgi:hypothetical protein
LKYTKKLRDRAIKESLVDQLEKSGITLNDTVEWLWEDFGKRVRPNWKSVRKAIVSDPEITTQDVAVFMIENDIMPEEGAWDVLPRPSLRGSRDDREG